MQKTEKKKKKRKMLGEDRVETRGKERNGKERKGEGRVHIDYVIRTGRERTLEVRLAAPWLCGKERLGALLRLTRAHELANEQGDTCTHVYAVYAVHAAQQVHK